MKLVKRRNWGRAPHVGINDFKWFRARNKGCPKRQFMTFIAKTSIAMTDSAIDFQSRKRIMRK